MDGVPKGLTGRNNRGVTHVGSDNQASLQRLLSTGAFLSAILSDGLADIFPGDSELAGMMRAHDWSASGLGAPADWPQSLKIPLRTLLTSRFEMWMGWGPDLAFFYNDAYRPTLGVKHGRVLGEPFREVWKEVYADVADRVETVIQQGVATWDKALLLLLERSGYPEETYHTFSYSPLHGDTGKVEGLMCIVTEETERVISERRLDTLRHLALGLADARTRADVLGAAQASLAANLKDFPFSLIYLFDAEGLPRLAGAAGLSPEHQGLIGAAWPAAEVLDGASPISLSLARLGPCPAGAWAIPPRDALVLPIPHQGDKRPMGFIVVGTNPYGRRDADISGFCELLSGQISAGLANADAFDSERRRADRIWGLSQEIMTVVRPDGAVASLNPAWERVLGWKPDDLQGQHYADLIHPDDLERSRQQFDRLADGGAAPSFDNRYRTPSGDYRWIRWTASTEDGLVYGVGRDVTDERAAADRLSAANDALLNQIEEREQVEATLRQMQKMESLGQLTGGIAHDFNNMLAVVIGGLSIARRRLAKGDTDIDRFITAALEGADRAASLTQRLLAFSRQQPLSPRMIEANRMIGGMSDLMERVLGEDIQVETVGAGRLWRAHADPSQLENAILNLAVNARDAMPTGGRLTIETANAHLDEAYCADHAGASPGQYVMIAVTDTGIGMTPEVRAKIFDPFFTTKDVGKGTGLGLSQVYGFLKQSGGYVDVYSEPGVGTTVKLYLPRFHGEQRPTPKPGGLGAPPSPTGEIVLVVEDEERVRALSVEALRELGYRVIEAEGPAAALRQLDANPHIDLLFTDVVMPDMNGRRLSEEALRRRPGLKVLYTTGYTRNAVVHNGVLDADVQLLSKPFSLDQLARKLRDALDS